MLLKCLSVSKVRRDPDERNDKKDELEGGAEGVGGTAGAGTAGGDRQDSGGAGEGEGRGGGREKATVS